jgi:hypothetical protein
MRTQRNMWSRKRATLLVLIALALSCAHRYSEDPRDWVGPHRSGRFESDFRDCRQKMDDKGFAYRADRRLILLDCMKKRGWTLKDAN